MMKRILILLTYFFMFQFALSLWIVNCHTYTNVYYVSQNGTGDGSSVSTPDSIADFNAGAFGELDDDVVYFLDTLTIKIVVPDSGTTGHYVTLRGDYEGRECSVTVANDDGILLDEDYTEALGFTITVADDQNDRKGVILNATGVVADNNIIIGAGSEASFDGHLGIYVLYSPGFSVTRNDISHVTTGIRLYTTTLGFAGTIGGSLSNGNSIHDLDIITAGTGDCINVGGNAVHDFTGLVISYNSMSQWEEDAIDLFYGSNIVVELNIMGPTSMSDDNGESNGNGLKMGSGSSTGNIGRYNIIKNIANTGINANNYAILTNNSNNFQLYGNLAYGVVQGLRSAESYGGSIYNNTLIASDTALWISRTLYDDLNTAANAASDHSGNEADATTGWTGQNAASVASVEDPYDGSYAIKITSGDASAERGEITITVESGEYYIVSFRAKRGAQGSGQGYKIWTGVVTSPSEAITGSSYGYYEEKVLTNDTSLLLRFYSTDSEFGGGLAGDELLVDDLRVSKVGSLTAQNNILSGDVDDVHLLYGAFVTGGYNCFKNDSSTHNSGIVEYIDTNTSDLYETDPQLDSNYIAHNSNLKNGADVGLANLTSPCTEEEWTDESGDPKPRFAHWWIGACPQKQMGLGW